VLFFALLFPFFSGSFTVEKSKSDALLGWRAGCLRRPRGGLGSGGAAPVLALLLGVRGPGRGPRDEHAGALAAALLQLLPRRRRPAVAGAVVVQRVGRWRQQRRAPILLLRRHMGAAR